MLYRIRTRAQGISENTLRENISRDTHFFCKKRSQLFFLFCIIYTPYVSPHN